MIVSKVKELMKEKKMSLRMLEEETKLAHQTVIRARGPLILECKLSTLQAIAAALGVQVSDLYEEVGEE